MLFLEFWGLFQARTLLLYVLHGPETKERERTHMSFTEELRGKGVI